jgi:hypothetical protein
VRVLAIRVAMLKWKGAEANSPMEVLAAGFHLWWAERFADRGVESAIVRFHSTEPSNHAKNPR